MLVLLEYGTSICETGQPRLQFALGSLAQNMSLGKEAAKKTKLQMQQKSSKFGFEPCVA